MKSGIINMLHWLTAQLLMISFWIWLLAWPIKPEWTAVANQAEVTFQGAIHCPHKTACYDGGMIYLTPYTDESGRSPKDQYLHELQHHFQAEARISERPGGYEKFLEILRDVIHSGRYKNEHQLATMKAMLATWKPDEAHADLPLILKGEIPPELADWYPWFQVETE